ncbi:ImmA/IrrE family metallo-endopeptidase [Clostridium sp. D2Q-11]|uniref:ImmA/IrrE family metallo-endopeptidase n=1 Tax=Anaeromonas frigoriresistens TaxID=2683708 RepID=A0A942UWG8_9FIRM|nr:ImmA/IrrE family metallo-endopeptidase [Anaeromonas frigoriresistens]MBS4538181.1 ImmA/IrrE family metallo-endopeptidase [Anaeromonas frigoriresistens]
MYEILIKESEDEGVEIIEMPFKGNIKGLYSDNVIAINKNIETDKEKKCILAEELGHHYTSSGDILDQSKVENRKQERRARAWGYSKLVSIELLIAAFKDDVTNRYELSKYLDVTEEYIDEALKYYKEKYGLSHRVNNFIVYFEPLSILEIWE